MSVSSCARCGRVIDSNSRNLCNMCIGIEDLEFKRIRDYLEINPGATVFQVSTELDIPIKNIKRFLRDDRLQIADRDAKNNSFLTCVKCGTAIRSGYYCASCATNVQPAKQVDSPIRETDSSEATKSTGIRFTQKNKIY